MIDKKQKKQEQPSAPADDTTVAQSVNEEVHIPANTIAEWFDPEDYENVVTDLEQDSLPEYFSGRYPSKTP